MRRSISRISLVAWVVVAALAVTTDAFAQRGPGRGGGGGGWGRGSQHARLFDPKTVETLEGTVESIEYHTPRNTTGRGVHVMLKTETETIAVHLGPEWFIEKQDTQIEKEDTIKVTGSRVTFEDRPAVIAAEVEKGDEVLELRDEEGFPRWAGWRKQGKGPGSGGWGPGSAYGRLFDPKTVETLEGEITNIHYHTPRDGRGRGVHAMLKTETETVEVHLGPRWFIDKQDVQIEAHDQVTVVGSRIEYDDKPAIIASEIQKGEDVLELRDKEGVPRWAGGRRVGASRTEFWDGAIVQYGKMHEAIGQQQHQGRVELKTLVERPHFYGVAALAQLEGEATILDGNVTLTLVDATGKLQSVVAPDGTEQATLLVGAYVPSWTEHSVTSSVLPDELDAFLLKAAAEAGIPTEKPFVFVVEGEFSQARLHVINGACPMHARLKNIALPAEQQPVEMELQQVRGTLIGIFAKDAVGDITHPATSTHMHLVFKDDQSGETVTGHVEQIGLAPGATMRLPAMK